VLYSMTGYGRYEQEFEEYSASVEVRSVNGRYLDINLRIPDVLSPFEGELRRTISEYFERGQISVKISLNGAEEKYSQLAVNMNLLHHYRRLIEEIRRELNLSNEPTLSDFLDLPDLFTVEQNMPDGSFILEHVNTILRQALRDIRQMQEREGKSLQADLIERLQWLQEAVQTIEKRARENARTVKKNLEMRISELLEDTQIDESRLAQEAAYLVDKVDITEETVRLKSHIDQFRVLLETDGGIGKKLNFLLQEMNREVNTIGAKANNAEISHVVVDCKNEIEKLREQVQNVE